MTLTEMTYQIAELVSHDPSTELLTMVKNSIISYRSLLYRREIERTNMLYDQFNQRASCLPTVMVDSTECAVAGLSSRIRRIEQPIPPIIRTKNKYAIKYLGTVDLLHTYSFIDLHQIGFLPFDVYAKGHPRYFILDGYVYIINADPEAVTIVAAFENPVQLFDFIDCSGNRIYTEESDFPVSLDFVQLITQSLINGELRLFRPESMEEIKTNGELPNTQKS